MKSVSCSNIGKIRLLSKPTEQVPPLKIVWRLVIDVCLLPVPVQGIKTKIPVYCFKSLVKLQEKALFQAISRSRSDLIDRRAGSYSFFEILECAVIFADIFYDVPIGT